MHRHLHLPVVALLLVIGCDRSSPVAPDTRVLDVAGMVTDGIGLPLAGVRVSTVNGPKPGLSVVTGVDGRFSMSEASGANGVNLQFIRDGFSPANVLVQPRSDLHITLWPLNDGSLEESGLGAGEYSLSVVADPACTTLPIETRTRTYSGSLIAPERAGYFFTIALGGATFFPTQRVAYGSSSAANVSLYLYSWEAETRWGDGLPIVEKIGERSYLSILGRATAPLPSDAASIATDLDGTLSYCSNGLGDGLWFQCATTPIDCPSKHHRLTLTAR